MASLTVLTWNLQGRPPDQVGLSELVPRLDPDLIFLQEADASALAAEPALVDWMRHSYADPRAGTWPGMAILSRLPLHDASTQEPTSGVWDRPRVLVASVAHSSGELLAVCVHAKAPLPVPFLHATARNRQLAALGKWLAQRTAGGRRIVAAGDFNAVSCRMDGLVDAAAAIQRRRPTWRPFGAPWLPAMLRLDRVFVSPSITPIAVRVACGASWSDHCPVMATFQLDGTEAMDQR
ncbi:MAG TPA: endonuclease/exonuclease/phosphatase family protein [Candidatus Dormibacteraeota bacterium]|nr:endonuclease/exonuclease/phosphatase family protein [Candidatus Dormibacteraeota bacterium]